LVLKGRVYEYRKFVYEPYTTGGTVEVYAVGGTLGEGGLIEGAFEITITERPTELWPFTEIFYDWVDPRAEPADVRIAEIYLRLKDVNYSSLSKEEVKEASGTYPGVFRHAFEAVRYFYADKDAAITLGENIVEWDDDETFTYEAATLKLTKGWNALWYKYPESAAGVSQTISVSVGNPDRKWVLSLIDENEDEDED
jgi:hypothetical protein